MTTNLAIVDAAPIVTSEQVELIKATVAKDATDSELQLFFFDCQRQGVHPLDRLIHFTKRGGKYTPITSIDFMRQRAAQTGECAGIDDAIFVGEPKTPTFAATVTVYRLVQGQRYAFTATARWLEYKPEQAFMWEKMPHVMLSKVAEALALRKGFPVQLAGLYAKEELDQADTSTVQRAEQSPGWADASGQTISPAQRTRFFTIARKAGWTDKGALRDELFRRFSVRDTAQITLDRYEAICTYFEQPPASKLAKPSAPPAAEPIDPEQPF